MVIPINKWEKEVLASLLDSEEETLIELEKQYKRALNDINNKVKAFQAEIDMLDAALESEGLNDKATEILKSQRRSKVYQKQFQEALQGQISGILDQMQGNNYSTIESYLKQTYEDAYIGTMYDLQGQGIPIISPIDQAAAVKAVMTDSKISNGLYTALGVDVKKLKKSISAEITRGIASSLSYADIARNLNNVSKAGLSNATRIVRTEGHRIQQASTMDAQRTAKAKGADVVKQWDSTLDGKTRPVHRRLDGQIREVDEPFEAGGMKAMAPGYFGIASQDCNCRCACLTRARWALDYDELETLKERAEFFGLDKTKDFDDFKKKFLSASDKIYSPINTRNTARGKAQGVVQFGTELNTRQKNLLKQLDKYDAVAIVDKKDVNMADLSALTAETGVEYALFTKGSKRMVVRGDMGSVNIDIDKAKELAQNGYRWSGHTHPGYDLFALTASDGDYNVLKAFGQKEGVIYNSLGQYMVFALE